MGCKITARFLDATLQTPYDIEIGCSAHMIYDKMREEESGRLFDPSARYVKVRAALSGL